MPRITLTGKAADMFVRAAMEASEPPVRVHPACSPPPGRRWWSGIWMTDDLLVAVAKEEGWKPGTACAVRDAAAWLNANGQTVVEAENEKAQRQPPAAAL